MPITLYDSEGNEVELPVESTEELDNFKEIQEKASQVDDLQKKIEDLDGNSDWKGLREAKSKAEKRAKELEDMLKEKDIEIPTGELTPDKVVEIAKLALEEDKINEVISKKETLLENLSRGDEQKKKAIENKFNELYGDNKITSISDMKQKMTDATILVNSVRDAGSNNTFNAINSPSIGGTPNRDAPKGGDREKAINNLKAMGYQFKSDEFNQ